MVLADVLGETSDGITGDRVWSRLRRSEHSSWLVDHLSRGAVGHRTMHIVRPESRAGAAGSGD